jgi:hypothetical protein
MQGTRSMTALSRKSVDIPPSQRHGFAASSVDFDYRRHFKVDTRAFLLSFAWTFRTKLKYGMLENKFTND